MAVSCIICGEEASPLTILTQKGANSVNLASKERKSTVVAKEGSSVHPECRKRFIDKKDILQKQKHRAQEEPAEESIAKSKRGKRGTRFACSAPRK